jgi:quinol monooxygenase YgiN
MILITGSITARPETIDTIRQLSLAHVARSRTEDGCLHHAVHTDCENPLRLVFVEHWRDRAAVAKHFADPAARTFAADARRLAAAATELDIFDATELPVSQLLC